MLRFTGVVAAALVLALVLLPCPARAADPTAVLVLGQRDFAGNLANRVDRRGLVAPRGVAIDTSVTPNRVYVADTMNHRVLAWNDVSRLTNGQSADLVIGQPDPFTAKCNAGPSRVSLCNPMDVAVDAAGNLYVSDSTNYRVLGYEAPFTHDTVPDRVLGPPDFDYPSFDPQGYPLSDLQGPQGIAVDRAGNVWVADDQNQVLEYDAPFTTDSKLDRTFGAEGGCYQSGGVSASCFYIPMDVALDAAGNLFVADAGNQRVLEFDAPRTTDAVADRVFGQAGDFTSNGFSRETPALIFPSALALDGRDNLFVGSGNQELVVEYDAPLSTDTRADRVFGQSVRPGLSRAGKAFGLAIDGTGALWLAEPMTHRVIRYPRPLSEDAANLILGQPDFQRTTRNYVDERGLFEPTSVAVDRSVTPNRVYVWDAGNNRILGWRDVSALRNGSPADLLIGQPDFFAGHDGFHDHTAPDGDRGLTVDTKGNLYVAEAFAHRVAVYESPFTTDTVPDRVFGQSGVTSFRGCNAGGLSARSLCQPTDVAVDSRGHLYVMDSGNNRLLLYLDPLTSDTVADKVFGQPTFRRGTCRPAAADTLCLSEECSGRHCSGLNVSMGLAVDGAGNLFASDFLHGRVLEFDDPVRRDTVADRVYGARTFGPFICYGRPRQICGPKGLAVSDSGALFVTEPGRIVRIPSPLTSPALETIFGGSGIGAAGPKALNNAAGLSFDDSGRLFVVDSWNNRVLVLDGVD